MADDKEKIIFEVQIDESAGVASSKKLETTIESLTAANKKLREERNKTNLETAEGKKKIDEINQAIDRNNKLIKENSSNLEQQRLNVGNYKNDIKDAANETNFFGTSIGEVSGKLEVLSGPNGIMMGAIAGLGALAAAYANSTRGAKDLAFAHDQLATVTKILSNSFFDVISSSSDAQGPLSKYISMYLKVGEYTPIGIALKAFGIDLGEVADKSKEAATGLQQLRELELSEKDAQRTAKVALDQAEVFRRIRDDQTKSDAERLDAANRVGELITQRETALVDVQKSKLEVVQSLLKEDKENIELQGRIKDIEFEIADIQEDSQGKRTEALNGIKTLQKEINDDAQKAKDLEEARLRIQKESADVKVKLDATWQSANATSREYIDLGLKEVEMTDELKESNEALNRELAKQKKIKEENIKNEEFAQETSLQGLSVASQVLNKNKGASSAIALASTFVSAQKAYESQFLPVPDPSSPIRGSAAAILATVQGLARVASINGINGITAAGGGRFKTKGPTMLIVGDNPGGVEEVTVKPISGTGVTKVSGNVVRMAGGGVLQTGPIETRAISSQITSERILRDIATGLYKQKIVMPIESFNILDQQIAEVKQAATI